MSRPLASGPRVELSGGRATVVGFVRARVWALTVWGCMLAWAVGVFAIVRDDYLNYRIGRFDLGNMVQAVWSTAQGRPLEFTTPHGEEMIRLGIHVDPILALLAPLWLAAPTPLTLAGAQIAACAVGALPLFWLGRRHLGSERTAALLAFAYLAYPWLAWTALDAIHPVTFAIPLLLFSIWFLDSDRLGLFAVCAVLAAATGELVGLAIAALGVWYFLARGRRAGLVIAGAGAAWTLLALLVVVPAFSGDDSSIYYGFYESVGGSPWGIATTVVTDPTAILAELFGGSVFLYLFLLAAPLAGMFLLAPGLAAVAIPQLAVNALADPLGPTDPRQHYLAAVVPFLFAATVLGVARVAPRRRVGVAVTVLVLSVAFSALLGPWSWAPGRSPLWYQTEVSSEHVAALDRAVAVVPDGAPASATNKAGLRLAARRYLAPAPLLGDAEWVVLDSEDPDVVDAELPALVRLPEVLDAFRARLESSPEWVRVFEEDGVYVYRKTRR